MERPINPGESPFIKEFRCLLYDKRPAEARRLLESQPWWREPGDNPSEWQWKLDYALWTASCFGFHEELIQLLIARGADIHTSGSSNSGTPLYYAARYHHLELVQYFLAHGADVHVQHSSNHHTPLNAVFEKQLSVTDDTIEIVRLVLEAGADPNNYTRRTPYSTMYPAGKTALQCAVRQNSLPLVELLVAYGADVNQQGYDEETPLFAAVFLALHKEDLTMLDWLLEHGADPNIPGRGGRTVLAEAAKFSRSSIIERLLQAGARPKMSGALLSVVDGFGKERFNVAERLVAQGADVNEPNAIGNKPLYNAILHHDTDMVKFLVEHGAPLDRPLKTYSGTKTPLEFARESPHYNEAIIDFFISRLAQTDPMRAQQESAQFLASGLLKRAREPRVGKPVTYWLEQGADPNARNQYGRTALHYIAEQGRSAEDAAELLRHGADANAKDMYGYTPLHDAILGDNITIVKLLLDVGADPAQRVDRGIHTGYTPFELARVEFKIEAAALLAPISPPSRKFFTACKPETWRDKSGTVHRKGFSHTHFEEDMQKNAQSKDIYLRECQSVPKMAKHDYLTRYQNPCVRVNFHEYGSEYAGTGIPRAEHPLRWRIAMEGCQACGSEDVLVIYASWCVHPMQGDLKWMYEIHCEACGKYSAWGYDEY